MTGKQRVGYRLLADAPRVGGHAFCVSTSDPADHARDRFAEFAPANAETSLRVVDCLTGTGAGGVDGADERSWYVSSPGDLTGVGVALSKAVAAVPRQANARVLLDSASTLLLYADVDAVYRFLHTTIGRLKSVDAHLFSTLHTDALDEQTFATLVQLFDLVVDVRSPDGTSTEIRLRGHPDVEATWRPFDAGDATTGGGT